MDFLNDVEAIAVAYVLNKRNSAEKNKDPKGAIGYIQ